MGTPLASNDRVEQTLEQGLAVPSRHPTIGQIVDPQPQACEAPHSVRRALLLASAVVVLGAIVAMGSLVSRANDGITESDSSTGTTASSISPAPPERELARASASGDGATPIDDIPVPTVAVGPGGHPLVGREPTRSPARQAPATKPPASPPTTTVPAAKPPTSAPATKPPATPPAPSPSVPPRPLCDAAETPTAREAPPAFNDPFWTSLAARPKPTQYRLIQTGRITDKQHGEIYFDFGNNSDVAVGDPLRIKRMFTFVHPVTGAQVSGWLPIGAAIVNGVAKTLSKASPDPQVYGDVLVGDTIEALVAAPPPAATPQGASAGPAACEWMDTWSQSAGRPLDTQIGEWEQQLAANQVPALAKPIEAHLDQLRMLRYQTSGSNGPRDGDQLELLAHESPATWSPRRPIQLVFHVRDPDAVVGAWLHYRTRGALAYKKASLARRERAFFHGQIPGDTVVAPGIEYFVEVATRAGQFGAAVGTAAQPIDVAVPAPPLSDRFAATYHRSQVALRTSYLDFANGDVRGATREDAFLLAEVDILYRLGAALYGIRTGVGALEGRGGSETGGTERTGFTYGYSEIELRRSQELAVLGRALVGVGPSGFGVGGSARLRLGAETGTSLSFGFAEIAKIGFLADISMQWEALRSVPLGFSIAATDQPQAGDVGVILAAGVGVRVQPWLRPSLRLSYQARSVSHWGIGAGLGLTFDW
jgi:hypothetical protein